MIDVHTATIKRIGKEYDDLAGKSDFSDENEELIGFMIAEKVNVNYFEDDSLWYVSAKGIRVFQPFMITALKSLYVAIHQVEEEPKPKRRRRKRK